MAEYLEFKKARCKDCYKCLRECPVKAIDVQDHQAKIIYDRCILCGRCTLVCTQNAKIVHSAKADVLKLLASGEKVIASVAPSFISSFALADFTPLKIALGKLGFFYAEETAVGANAVVKEYKKLLESGEYKNFITSACPAANRLIQLYYPKALRYLAPVDSPMIAHAKILKAQYPDAKIVFIGPCIAKKREADESGLVEQAMTFESLRDLLAENNIILDQIAHVPMGEKKASYANLAKRFPVSRGIIKSFDTLPAGYEYIAIDGTDRCVKVLENIDALEGVFLELNTCENACVNGPCSLLNQGSSVKAMVDIRAYVNREIEQLPAEPKTPADASANKAANLPVIGPDGSIDFSYAYPRLRTKSRPATETEIKEVLAKTGKFKPEDELNCGACGYPTCREKAWAVVNGYADIEICLPFMRERSESMSYEVIQSSPDGIVVLDSQMQIMEMNDKAKALYGIEEVDIKGRLAADFFSPADYMQAWNEHRPVERKHMSIPRTNSYVDLVITQLKGHDVLFGILTDVSKQVKTDEMLDSVRMETLATTDEVIKKQMRVAQEIASLLGETTAETKIALLKLKQTFRDDKDKH